MTDPTPESTAKPLFRQMAEQALARSAGAPLVDGNQVSLLFDAAANFASWQQHIAAAREEILIEMYLFADDDFGRQIRSLLLQRLAAGVRVYLLYDWLGCWREHYRGFFQPLQQAGADVRAWQAPGWRAGLRLLGRDHRKLIIVDGQTAFIGGLCISARWLDWRDSGLMLQGPLLQDAVAAFADSWYASGGVLSSPLVQAATAGSVSARLIATTPATARLMRVDLLIAGFARERLWLTDAYFMGTSAYLSALCHAARDGVDVRLLVPRSSDIPWIATVSRTLYRPLLEAGVRVFEWNGAMMHAKTALADSRWARIGSTNLNLSSWLANRELDLAIEDTALAQQLAERFLQDLDHATEVVLQGRRTTLASPRQQRPRLPLRQHAAAGAAAAARQAARLGEVLDSAVRGSRELRQGESRAFASIALVLLLLAALMLWQPYLVAIPLALLLVLLALHVLLRAWPARRPPPPPPRQPPAP